MSTRMVALSVTPGTLSATVPENDPAIPAGVMTRLPAPSETVSRSLVPSPMERRTPLRPTRTNVVPLGRVKRSKATLPDNVWPAMVKLTPTPSTRTYGPAGSCSRMVLAPTVMLSSTAVVVVLTATANVPLKLTPATPSRATDADSEPATPLGVMRKKPVPSLTVRTPPRERPTRLAPTRTTAVPSARPTRSSVKSPVNVCPATVSVTSVPATRRYGPAGRVTPPTIEAVSVVLSSRRNVPPRETAGNVTATVASSRPATPAAVTMMSPLMSVTETTGVVPPRESEPSSTVIRRIRVPSGAVLWRTEKEPLIR